MLQQERNLFSLVLNLPRYFLDECAFHFPGIFIS